MPGSYKLTYFNSCDSAEVSRMELAAAGQKFEGVRIEPGEWGQIRKKVRGKSNHVVENWCHTLTFKPELYFEPETTEEIKQIVDTARKNGKKVSVVGAAHSFNDCANTKGYMICLKKYNRVLSMNKDKCQVTVQAGMVTKHLYEEVLPKHGLATKAVPLIHLITVGGMISTGAHGTGGKSQISSTYVVAMEIMTSFGEILRISETENKELLPAARLALGTLGVILNVTLQCVPAYNLHEKTYGADMEEVIQNYDKYWDNVDHFQYWWSTYTDKGMLQISEKTDKPPMLKRSWFWTAFIGGIVARLYDFLYWLTFYLPSLLPWVEGIVYHGQRKHRVEKIDRSDRVFNCPFLFVDVMEYCVPREDALQAFKEYKQWVERTSPGTAPAHGGFLFRFVKADDIYLSPNYKMDGVYFNISLSMPYYKYPPNRKSFDEFERIMRKYGGRPHWGKVHGMGPADFEKCYPEWNKFHAIRRKIDPCGMFMTESLLKVFGK